MYKYLSKKAFTSTPKTNPFNSNSYKDLKIGKESFKYYDINNLGTPISKQRHLTFR